MSGVRPMRPDDLPAVVALRPQAFRSSLQEGPEALARYFERIFLRLPWRDESLPSLVYEDRAGRVRGFLGVVPRRMRLGAADIRVAVPTQFMVHPDSRGIAGVQLMRRFLDGPQDLALSDRGNDAARLLWERLGGSTSLLYSLFWTRRLRRARYRAVRLANTRLAEAAVAVARPAWGLIAAAADLLTVSAGPRAAPPGTTEPLDPAWMVEHFAEFVPPGTLQPVYDEPLLRWLFAELAAKGNLGTLRAVLVRDPDGAPIGWFLYYANPRGVSQVVQLVARPECGAAVIDHLLYRAVREGTTAVQGRMEPQLLPELGGGSARCRFDREGPWMLAHAREPDLLAAVLGGHAFVSRLDSEWWLNF